MTKQIVKLMAAIALGGLAAGCAGEPVIPQTYDIAFIEQTPGLDHLRFLSDSGSLSDPVYLPDDLEVYIGGQNSLSWSADGTQLAFASYFGGNLEIFTLAANGQQLRRITTHAARDESPSWNPDGSGIVFLSSRDSTMGESDVYVYEFATGNVTRISPVSGLYRSPDWSPDSSRIVYGEAVNSTQDTLFVYDVAAGTTVQVPGFPMTIRMQGIRWAPSLNTLIFYLPGTWSDVYSVNVDGTGLQALTGPFDTLTSAEPSWYSGNRILFTEFGNNPAPAGIYFMNANGSGKTLLRELDSYPRSPVYRFASVNAPDLVVDDFAGSFDTSDPTSPKYAVTVKIRNIGTAASQQTLAYINALNTSVPEGVNEIRIQKNVQVPALASGETSSPMLVEFDLAEIYAKAVHKMEILADPKNTVDEAFETNNTERWVWP